jgi:hypothetical protein
MQRIESASLDKVVWQMPAAVIVVEAPSGEIILRNRRAQQWREVSLRQARSSLLSSF